MKTFKAILGLSVIASLFSAVSSFAQDASKPEVFPGELTYIHSLHGKSVSYLEREVEKTYTRAFAACRIADVRIGAGAVVEAIPLLGYGQTFLDWLTGNKLPNSDDVKDAKFMANAYGGALCKGLSLVFDGEGWLGVKLGQWKPEDYEPNELENACFYRTRMMKQKLINGGACGQTTAKFLDAEDAYKSAKNLQTRSQVDSPKVAQQYSKALNSAEKTHSNFYDASPNASSAAR